MKKLILTLLLEALIMAGAFAKSVVVYFSATGTTEKMAKSLAAEVFQQYKNNNHKM